MLCNTDLYEMLYFSKSVIDRMVSFIILGSRFFALGFPKNPRGSWSQICGKSEGLTGRISQGTAYMIRELQG